MQCTNLSVPTSFFLKHLLWVGLLLSPLQMSADIKVIDTLVEKTMQTFQVPGVAIGIIKDGEIIHLKGYGIANLDNGLTVDENTIFKIASNSKAFTTAALAILVDEGKLDWQDKVTQYLPDFQMYDPWVTEEFNIIDLLTHRSGLPKGAGDLMLWPEPTKFNRSEVIKNLRYLKPVTSFRDQYAYDNLLYIVAGEVIAAISGQAWEDFIKTAIFQPLKMTNCFAGGIDVNKMTNIVAPHRIINDHLRVDQPNLMNNKTSLMAAAGGIKCSASDLLKWIAMQLQGGKMPNGTNLFSLKQSHRMWRSVTRLTISSQRKQLDKTHFRGYALGWRVSDFHGEWRVSHTGSLSGSMSQIILLPDQQLGIVILTNQSSSSARNSLARGILQEFTAAPQTDWVDYYVNRKTSRKNSALDHGTLVKGVVNPIATPITDNLNTKKLLGTFVDPWFGQITLSRVKGDILFKSDKSPRLTGKVYFHKPYQWWVKWDDRSFEADAWLFFNVLASSPTIHLLMTPISPTADFSFDFEDLNFVQQ